MAFLHVHRLCTIGATEVESTLLGAVGAESELLWGLAHGIVRILVLIREVLLDDVVRLHVDLLVGVGLAVVDLLHAAALLDEQRVAVDRIRTIAGGLLVELSDLQDVLEAVQGYLDDLVVGAGEQIAKGLMQP